MCSLLHQRFSVNFKSKLPYWKEMHTNPEKYPTRVFVPLTSPITDVHGLLDCLAEHLSK